MSLRDCMIKNGWDEAEITALESQGRALDNEGLADVLYRQVGKMEASVRRAKLQMLKLDAGVKAVNAHPDGPANGLLSMLAFDKTGKSGTLSVDLMTNQYARMAYREMSDLMQGLMPNWREGWRADHVMRRNVVNEVLGKTTGDKQAGTYAKQYLKANDLLVDIINGLGGKITKKNNYLPQMHNAVKVRKVDKQEWVNFIMDGELVDYRQMVDKRTDLPFNNIEELRPSLESMYDAISTNGASKMDWDAAQFKNIQVAGGSKMAERFLVFSDGDKWIKYQKNFGEEDIYSSMVTHLQGLSREAALIKQFGPNYGAAYNFIRAKAAVQKGVNNRLLGRADNVMKELTGELAGTNNKLQEWAERIRAVMTFKLGSASISALGDQGTLAITAAINDIPVFDAHMKFLKNLAKTDEKQFLLQSGVNAEYVIDVTSGLNRYADVDQNQFMGKAADRYMKLSGLDPMTQAAQASIQLSALGHLANVEKRAWSELSTGNLRMLQESGITEADWKIMARSKKQNVKGAKYLDMRELPLDLQMKVGNMMDILSYRAVPAPDAEVRAILRQGTQAGTIAGELLRSGGQFKSFGVSVLLYHPTLAIAMGPQTGGAYMGGLLALTTMMGGVAVMSKELVAGREPMSASSPEFWLRAFLQGGGAGIFGDFIFRDYTRYGNSFMGTLAGPSLSAFETVVTKIFLANSQQAIKDIIDGEPEILKTLAVGMTSAAVNELKKTLPTQIWYTKLLTDRYLYGSIQQMIDTDYIKKMNKREAKLLRDEDRGNLFEPFEL